MGHIGILVVVVRRLSRRWKVKTLLAGPSPTSPVRRRLPTPLFPTVRGGKEMDIWKSSSRRVSRVNRGRVSHTGNLGVLLGTKPNSVF